MNFRQLDYFLGVAECGSFTAAALALKVAQPTLTKSIRGLEQELGTRLFERLARGVVLTPSGVALRRHAERIGVQMRDAVAELSVITGGTGGPVAIGAGPSWLRRLLPEAVARAVTEHPSIQVSVTGGYDDVLLKALRAGELDFVVAELPPREAARDLTLRPLTADRLCVFCRDGHPLAGQKALGFCDLLAYPWVMPPRNTRPQQRLIALFVAADLPPPTIAVETESMAFLLKLLLSFDALTLTVSSTDELVEAAGTLALDVPELVAERTAGVIARQGGWLSPAAMVVIDSLAAACAGHARN